MSGFLKGAKNAPSDVMTVRDEGRVLFIGVTSDGQILGYAVGSDSSLAKEVYAKTDLKQIGVFLEIPPESRNEGYPEAASRQTDRNLLQALDHVAKAWSGSSS